MVSQFHSLPQLSNMKDNSMPSGQTSTPKFQLFTDHVNRGFTLMFDNGVTVSVRWGTMNHSDGFNTAECAALFQGDFIHIPGFMYGQDDVLSSQSANQVAQFMETAARIDNPETFGYNG